MSKPKKNAVGRAQKFTSKLKTKNICYPVKAEKAILQSIAEIKKLHEVKINQ